MSGRYKSTVIACYIGYVVQAIINNLAPILFVVFQTRFSISFEQIGRLIFFNFGTQLLVDILAVRLVDKIGYRTSAVLAHGFSAAGLLSLGILPMVLPSPYLGTVISVVIYAIGGGLIEVLISPIVDAVPSESKSSAMSLLHSFYCWGQVAVVLFSTLTLHFIGTANWFCLPLVWAAVPLLNLFNFLHVPMVNPSEAHTPMSVRKLLSSKLFLISLILMTCAGASEIAMSQWSSLFAEKGLHVSKVVGDLLGPCLFAVLMGTGRLLYGIFGRRIHLHKALLLSSLLCIVCYCITAMVQNPFVSLIGCAVCGLSVSLMWPGLFSLTAEAFPSGGTAMFGLLALFGDIGCAVGPWISGLISDSAQKAKLVLDFASASGQTPEQIGLKLGVLAAVVFPVGMLLGLVVLNQKRKHSTPTERSIS